MQYTVAPFRQQLQEFHYTGVSLENKILSQLLIKILVYCILVDYSY